MSARERKITADRQKKFPLLDNKGTASEIIVMIEYVGGCVKNKDQRQRRAFGKNGRKKIIKNQIWENRNRSQKQNSDSQ